MTAATAITLESLGLDRDEITNRIIDRIVDRALNGYDYDEDGEEISTGPSKFLAAVQARVKERVDRAVEEIAAKHVLPNVATYLESLCLQETNRWGEKIGRPVTFIEYIVGRAEAYMTEQVDYSGKPKGTDSFGWAARSTRVAYMIHQHLHHQIETAMKSALAQLNSSVAKGLHETVRIQINEVLAKLKVEVKT